MSTGLTPEQVSALEVSRQFIALGVPMFAAAPALDGDGNWMPDAGIGGYWLPRHWQKTVPTANWLDPSVPGFEHKAWRPGYALCAVMGHALDALDCDPRHGGDVSRAGLVSEGLLPTVYATATTPSGGTHELIRSLGIASRDGFLPGLDLKGGKADGSSRGFVFVPPTVKVSKVTGQLGTYAWTSVVLDAFDAEDTSGKALAEVVRPSRGAAVPVSAPLAAAPVAPADDTEAQRLAAYTQSVRDREVGRLTAMREAATPDGRGYRGEPWDPGTFSRSCNLLELANSPWSDYTVEMAYADVVAHAPTDAGFTSEHVNKCWQSAVSTVGDRGRPYPVTRMDSLGIVEQWAAEDAVRVDPVLFEPPAPPVTPADPRLAVPGALAAGYPHSVVQIVEKALTTDLAHTLLAETRAFRSALPEPDEGTLAELLARPEPANWRIEGFMPAGGRLLVSAMRKTGKTTFIGNLAVSLLTGEDFLGRFPVRPLDGQVVVLNYEVTGRQFAAWMADIGVPADRCHVINLRGCRNLLADDIGRHRLIEKIKQQHGQVLMVDPFGRAYTGTSQNDAAEITPWLVRLDEVAQAAGCDELVLTAHTGWNGERTRGSSALEDWPDSIVTLARDSSEESNGRRFLRAEGRDVEVEEDALHYDPSTRRLSLTGNGSRQKARKEGRLNEQVDVLRMIVAESPGINIGGLTTAIREGRGSQHDVPFRKEDISRASVEAVRRGVLRIEQGSNRQRLHYLPGTSRLPGLPQSPQVSPGEVPRSPRSPYRGETGTGTADQDGSPHPSYAQAVS